MPYSTGERERGREGEINREQNSKDRRRMRTRGKKGIKRDEEREGERKLLR